MERALSTFIPEVSLRENILVGVCKVLSDSVCDACIVVVFLFCSGVFSGVKRPMPACNSELVLFGWFGVVGEITGNNSLFTLDSCCSEREEKEGNLASCEGRGVVG